MSEQKYAIVADIGGTNARFSRVHLGNLAVDNVHVYPCNHFPNLSAAWSTYLGHYDLASIKQAAIAIACPIKDDLIMMTNSHWQFSVTEVKQELGLDHLHVVNDFTAAAMCLPILKQEEKIQIGGVQAIEGEPMVILGAGTGLGVAHLIPTDQGFLPLAGEGGHVDWAAQTEQEWFIYNYLKEKYRHVSAERVLSGPGLEQVYLALAALQGLVVQELSAKEIVQLALSGHSRLATATVEQFLASLGSFAGDLALTANAYGGVYLAGGILPRLISLIDNSHFRLRFESKGRFSAFNREIPCYVIVAEQPGLIGAANYLKQCMGH